jgi:hypothetical protein
VALAVVDRVALGLEPLFIGAEADTAVSGELAGIIAARIDANTTTKISRAANTKISRKAFDRLSHQIPTKLRVVGGKVEHTVCARARVL